MVFKNVSLQNYNLYAAAAHGIAFIVLGILMLRILRPEFRITSFFRISPDVNEDEPARDTINRPAKLVSFFNANIPYLVLAFFGFTVFFHLLYATNAGPGGWYTRFIAEGHNPVRFLEYAISAGIMAFIICAISGVREANGTWAVVLSIASVMIQGAIVERQLFLGPLGDKQTVRYATFGGWLLLLAAWVPIGFTLYNVINDIRNVNESYRDFVPNWIPIFTLVQLLQFAAFGFVQLKQVRPFLKDLPMPPYESIERSYILNSFTTKLVLGAFIAYGLLDRQKRNDDWVRDNPE